MAQAFPTRDFALIVNLEADDTQRQLGSGEEAVDGDGYGVVTVVRLNRAPLSTDTRPIGHFWFDTTASQMWYRTATEWIRLNIPYQGVWYNSATQLLTTTAATITINTAQFTNDAGASFTLATNQVTVLKAGVYEIGYDATALAAGNNNRTSYWLERNTVTVPGTAGRTAGNSSGFGASASGRCILTVTANDVIRLRGQVSGGANANTVAQGCRLQIREIR